MRRLTDPNYSFKRTAATGCEADPKITVKHSAPHDSSFFALVECTLALEQNAGGILAELMVTTVGNDKHVFLEQISYAA